jgi:hypothetical protein
MPLTRYIPRADSTPMVITNQGHRRHDNNQCQNKLQKSLHESFRRRNSPTAYPEAYTKVQ